jgi:hypothetical protein
MTQKKERKTGSTAKQESDFVDALPTVSGKVAIFICQGTKQTLVRIDKSASLRLIKRIIDAGGCE